jgi:hypothetical protein
MSDYIIIGFSKSKGFKPLSKAIMYVEDTNYSHTYIKLSNRHFNDFDIYHASKGMVNHMVEKTFLEENEIVKEFSIPIDIEKKKEVINDIRYKLGKPYSKITMLVLFFVNILRRFNISTDFIKIIDGEEAYICSELVVRILKANNIIDLDINLDKATPKQIMQILNNKYN